MQPLPKVLELYLEITRYPILAKQIRKRMREELFSRHVIDLDIFENEVLQKAIESQELEGLDTPYEQESLENWEERLQIIRDQLTDFYFAYNLPHSLFVEIVQSLIKQQNTRQEGGVIPFSVELAPWAILFAKGKEYENYPAEERSRIQHHLQEILVVLIKGLISDQLGFMRIAKNFFTIADLEEIRERRIGRGKIGGKAAGLLLAHKILQQSQQAGEIDLEFPLIVPESYYIGADVFHEFFSMNVLHDFLNQKYKTGEAIAADYPRLIESVINSTFPEEVSDGLRQVLEKIGPSPLIVRSSSLLEDNFGSAFAGKYESFFCPNQGTPEQNLAALCEAIKRIYASVDNPSALLYRQHKGLIDSDERMAILIQKVVGGRHDRYFFPSMAGVAFSRNPYRWTRKIRREDGLLRLVWGMGTRAVERVANDYPRMVALSHPTLRPEKGSLEEKKYSQHYVDVVDLDDNQFKTLPISQLISARHTGIRMLASVEKEDYLQPIYSLGSDLDPESMVLTFDGLVQDERLMSQMKQILKTLEYHYEYPVDVEFAADILNNKARPDYQIYLLQCRPLTSQDWGTSPSLPNDLAQEDKIFVGRRMVPQGVVRGVRYVVYVAPQQYSRIPDQVAKREIGRVVGRLNKRLKGERFILLGPGRWGSSNIDLGVNVSYADIYNTQLLGEIAMEQSGETPELSYGTHFFQDLVESGIYPLALCPAEPGEEFNAAFLDSAPNVLADLLPADREYSSVIKVIEVPAVSGGRFLDIIMDADKETALGYLNGTNIEATPV